MAILAGVAAALVGIVVLVLVFAPGATEFHPAVFGVALPVHAVLLLLAIYWRLRQAGTGWRELGFTRPK